MTQTSERIALAACLSTAVEDAQAAAARVPGRGAAAVSLPIASQGVNIPKQVARRRNAFEGLASAS